MDTGNFISQLRDVRANLIEAVRQADNFEFKLVGPRPADGLASAPKQPAESVGTLLSDLNSLSLRLAKMIDHQHEIIGEFAPKDCAAPQPARYA